MPSQRSPITWRNVVAAVDAWCNHEKPDHHRWAVLVTSVQGSSTGLKRLAAARDPANGNSVLHLLVQHGAVRGVEELLALGLDPRLANHDGVWPQHVKRTAQNPKSMLGQCQMMLNEETLRRNAQDEQATLRAIVNAVPDAIVEGRPRL